jgi:hypothetical protein
MQVMHVLPVWPEHEGMPLVVLLVAVTPLPTLPRVGNDRTELSELLLCLLLLSGVTRLPPVPIVKPPLEVGAELELELLAVTSLPTLPRVGRLSADEDTDTVAELLGGSASSPMYWYITLLCIP